MKTITANFFECKVRYEKMQEDGKEKRVQEQYVVDALSFTEAEQRIAEEMSAYILVQAPTLDQAVRSINDVMSGTMIDYEKSNIAETKILDVFIHENKTEGEQA